MGETGMVVVSIRMRVRPEQREGVLATIRRFVEPSVVEPGCLGIRCFQDAADHNFVTIQERWESHEDLQRHIRRPAYRAFLDLLESSVERPIVEFHDVAATHGMELIEGVLH